MGSTLAAAAAAMSAFALGAGASDSPAQANVPPQERLDMLRRYDLGAAPLANNLNAFADENRLQIVYDSGVTGGLRSRGLVGDYSVREALDRLLAGSGLSYRLSEMRSTISIQLAQADNGLRSDAGAEALPPIDVGAEQSGDNRAARGGGAGGTGKDPKSYVAPVASTGTKTNTPIMETPLNVQVVTQQVLRDRQVYSIEDAVKNVSGVTTAPTTAHDPGFGGGILIRGFQTNSYFRNGFRNDYGGIDQSSQQFANVDSMEVLKGSAAILYGLVDPRGIVNVVTKQPQETPAYSLQQQVGSFATYRTTVGATGPISQQKSVLYRVDMSYENSHFFTDFDRNETFFIAPVVKWNIDRDTQATVEFEYNKTDQSASLTLTPTYNGQILNIPRSRNYGEYAPIRQERFLFGLNWPHKFCDDWELRHRIQYVSKPGTLTFIYPQALEYLGSRVLVDRQFTRIDIGIDTFSTNADLIGHFDTGELRHTLLAGADFYRNNYWQEMGQTAADSRIDIFDPIHPGAPLRMTPGWSGAGAATNYDYGVYVQDQIKLPFGLQLLGGVRYQNTNQLSRSANYRLGNYKSNDPNRADRVTPRVGVLWRPQNWLSVYANYVEGFGPNYGLIYPTTPVPPSDARQWEVGAKAEFFDGRLRATFAYFDLSKTNIATADLAHPGYSLVTGEVNAKGPEFDLQGEILPGWNVILAYANTETRITKGNDTDSSNISTVGSRFPNVPRNTASFWSTYEFKAGALEGLKFGGGVTYRDAQRILDYADARSLTDITPYATVDIMGSYTFVVAGEKLTAQLNVTNLLDHSDYTAGGNYFPVTPGQG